MTDVPFAAVSDASAAVLMFRPVSILRAFGA
jgi:hypothetical protein